MTVLIVASFPASILAFRGALIKSMAAKGRQVHVAAPGLSRDSRIKNELEELGTVLHDIPLKRTATNPFQDFGLLWYLFLLMRRIRPDIVLGYTVKPVIFGSIAAWIAGVPRRFALITGLGYAFTGDRDGLLAKLVKRLYAFALVRTHKVFFQNPDDEAFFLARRILSNHTPSVVVNGSGVDLDTFTNEPPEIGSIRFLMICRLLGDKGVREYVQAARLIRAKHQETRFRLVGWIDENPDAVSKTELNVWVEEGVIEFLGRLEDVRPEIVSSSVYVLPSYREGTPRTVLEAMAIGRAIVTTDAPGCRETVIEGENGFLVETRSVESLVEAMQQFVDNPDLVEKMGRRSREIAEEKYDVHKVNAVMLHEMGIK